jgi:reductive dehalogenase
MKKLSLEEWEQKYVVGKIEPFDQKYTMFNRPDWDMELRSQLDDWSFLGQPKNKPGWEREDLAMRMSTQPVAKMLTMFNGAKPNPYRVTQVLMKALDGIAPGMSAPLVKPPKGSKIEVDDPRGLTAKLKKVALYFGADLVGVCRLDRRWVYSHSYEVDPYSIGKTEEPTGISHRQEVPENFQYAVVLGFKMDYHVYRYTNSVLAGAATGLGYAQMAFTNALVSEYITNLGYSVIDCTTNDVALTVPMAMQAGMGDIGRNGLLITPRYGPRVRLSKVITDLPLSPDSPVDFGVTEFCNACGKCADHCPSKSIMHGGRSTEPRNASNSESEKKWPVNAETCRQYWAKAKKGGGCTLCISTCPYNRVDTWPHRFVRWCIDHTKWANKLFIFGDDLLGYGRPKKADRFWEEWQPK